jgi:hypothetical protein
MSEGQSLSSIVPLTVIERPACPKCQAQMMLARIVPAFAGTALHTFECAACNYALKTLAACEDSKLSEGLDAAVKPFSADPCLSIQRPSVIEGARLARRRRSDGSFGRDLLRAGGPCEGPQ